MDNMKARCWYGAHMPLLALEDDARALAQLWLRQMIDLTESSSRLLQTQVKEAWFSRPKDAKGDVSLYFSDIPVGIYRAGLLPTPDGIG
ncbi:hypothetical protein CF392_16295 [Tamilnaduibacter salinus]|uniref:Uncharacterized protein n=1 Tax=Tamilnaduibacter salinus TaxID=1484056 RepID=A0A2A2HZW6_9GAMM|nr:hypothetical protein CF392_16295 [Tamilnaduibacter salinus]